MPISFPGLFGDWSFNPDPIAVHIGHGIYWYGIILAIGLLAGLVLCMKQAKRYGLTEDNVLDMVLWAVPSCIIGARLYYVIFYLDLYRNADGSLNWGEMVAVWDGGLAIYGAVIAGAIVAFFYTRHKKIKMGAMTDLAVMGLLLGQCIGRWANFINREAFGAETTLPWRMRLWTSATEYIEVHPTFFYESLWNLIGLLLILLGPCAQVLLTIAAYRLCAAAIEPLGAERIAPALQDFADILTTLFILMISIGAMFFVFVAALMRMGMGFA